MDESDSDIVGEPTGEVKLQDEGRLKGEGKLKDWEKPNDLEKPEDSDDKGKHTRTPLPLGLDRLRPYAAHILPVDIDLGHPTYTHEGRSDGLSTLAARGQVAMSTWNERRGSKSRTGRKRAKLVGEAIWVGQDAEPVNQVRRRAIHRAIVVKEEKRKRASWSVSAQMRSGPSL